MLVVQSLPQSQKDIIIEALSLLETKCKEALELNEDDMNAAHKSFDVMTLKSMMNYDVNVVLTQEKFNRFTADNGVDFPEFI